MKNVFPNDIIIEINSDDTLEKLLRLNLPKKVKGGIVVRNKRKALPFLLSEPLVGDKLILMGVDASISELLLELVTIDR